MVKPTFFPIVDVELQADRAGGDRDGATELAPSYVTADVDGNEQPHSISVWQTEVYSYFSPNVTVTFPSTMQTSHGFTHLPPALTKADVASKCRLLA